MSTAKIITKVKKAINLDGWINIFTGLGIKGKDKRASSTVAWEPLLEEDASELYAQDAIAAKIVDLLPEAAFKKEYKITGVDDDTEKKLKKQIAALFLNERMVENAKWSRLYGGSAIIPITKDTKGTESPFQIGAEITGFRVFNRHELQPQTQTQVTSIDNPDFGKVMQFALTPRGMTASYQIYIHRSRLGIMLGTKLPADKSQTIQWWGDSVLTRMVPSLQSYAGAHDSAAAVLLDFRTAIFKIKGLADALASGADDAVIKRLEMVNMSRGIARAVVVDADGEDFEYRESSLSGVSDLISKAENRLVAESEYPHTILLGESPDGSNATGNSTDKAWYAFVASYQKNDIKPVLVAMIQRIAAGMQVKNYAEIDVEFAPLEDMDEKDIVANHKTQAEADEIYVNMGAIDPREVAMSRFGGDKYSYDTVIEKDLREQKPLTAEEAAAAKVQTTVVNNTYAPVKKDSDDEDGEDYEGCMAEMDAYCQDGGEGSGPQGGAGSSAISKASSRIQAAGEREAKATNALKALQAQGKYSFNSPEGMAASKEYRSAVRERQTAVREGRKTLAIAKAATGK